MRTPRIFCSKALAQGQCVVLDEAGARHVHQVLRLHAGDALVLFDGEGGEYQAVIRRITRREVEIELGAFCDRDVESPLVIHLGQGISRGERMDFTVQKSVELGLASVTPLYTERCMVKLAGSRSDKRLDHWRSVARSACEQSGRNRIPVVHEPQNLASWLPDSQGKGVALLLDPTATNRLRDIPPPDRAVTLLIGPEGGLSDGERVQAKAAGFIGVSLGPRILRTETAALAALSAMQALWGDF